MWIPNARRLLKEIRYLNENDRKLVKEKNLKSLRGELTFGGGSFSTIVPPLFLFCQNNC